MSKGKKKILLIDDNQDSLDMLELFLYKHYDVTAATSGFSGLDLARSINPDCIFTDINMPGMDGIKLFNTLRNEGFNIPLIAITSFSSMKNRKSLRNIGFEEVITKPFAYESLIHTLSRIIDDYPTVQSELKK